VDKAGRPVDCLAGSRPSFSRANDDDDDNDNRNDNDARRLKRNVVRVGRLANGLPLYRFRYLWSDLVHVGVMAQEVLPVMPDAVLVGEDGFMRVDYERLGTRMMTWDEWQRRQTTLSKAAA
jgi:hypothetical protein